MDRIASEYIDEFAKDNKIGLISTIDNEGYPHITLISTVQARNEKQLIWGQFSEGMSKKNVRSNPATGFLIMNFDREIWRGKALWTHSENTGPEFDMFNEKPLFRYNSYFGIGRVHYMDLVEIGEKEKLNMVSIVSGAILSRLTKPSLERHNSERVMNPFSEKLFNKMAALKFVSFIGNDGFPVITPVMQALAADSGRIAFCMLPYGNELEGIPAGKNTAVYCFTLEMEHVLIKGKFMGTKRQNCIKTGVIDIEKVYNSMLPKAGYIYPQEKLVPVTEFK